MTDKLDKGTNPAVDTLADTVYSELKAGRDVHLMGYSQGGLITARALFDVQKRLRLEDGLSKAQVEQLMSHLEVETFGAASTERSRAVFVGVPAGYTVPCPTPSCVESAPARACCSNVARHVTAALEALEGGNLARAATLLRILLS